MGTHTFAKMPISAAAWDEIAGKLKEAGYKQLYIESDGQLVLDMEGIRLVKEIDPEAEAEASI